MARRSKSERNLDQEVTTLNFMLNLIEAGRLDHIYVYPHEKAAAVAFFKAKIEAATKRYVRGQSPASKAELDRLRTLHRQAREQRESLWRDRMWADAMLAQRDPTMPLQ